MRYFKEASVALVGLLSTFVSADAAGLCPSNANKVCFAVAVPASSAASNSGNIYFQISAPVSYQWVALGTGSQMQGSNIFLVYQNGRGNMTLSPRRGTRWTQPSLDTSSTAAKLTLLSGSGLTSDGQTMIANIACSNCQSWNGGSMTLSSTSSSWVGAWHAGSSLATTNQAANIDQHDDTTVFSLDLSKATIATDSNPFSSANAGATSGGASVISSGANMTMVLAHGVIMALIFVLLFPVASTLMPLLGKWKAHAAFQIVNWLLMWVGFGIGVQIATDKNMLFNTTHTTLGTVVVVLLAIQPVLGWMHHMYYVKHQRRGVISTVHVVYGQALIVIGLINGGLGLELAGAPNQFVVAYAVVAALVFVMYAVFKVFTLFRARKNTKGDDATQLNDMRHRNGNKLPGSPPGSEGRRYS